MTQLSDNFTSFDTVFDCGVASGPQCEY